MFRRDKKSIRVAAPGAILALAVPFAALAAEDKTEIRKYSPHRPEDNRPEDKRNMPFRPGEDKDKGVPLGDKPELRDFRRFTTEAPTGADAIMLKHSKRMTEGEMISLINQPGYGRNEVLNRKVRQWHLTNYGDGTIPRDATGRQINMGPMRGIPKTETPPLDADGGGLPRGLEAIAGLVTRAAGNTGLPGGVKALQSVINDVTEGDERFPAMPLKKDGIFGPATRERLRNVVARRGSGAVAGAFRNFRF